VSSWESWPHCFCWLSTAFRLSYKRQRIMSPLKPFRRAAPTPHPFDGVTRAIFRLCVPNAGRSDDPLRRNPFQG